MSNQDANNTNDSTTKCSTTPIIPTPISNMLTLKSSLEFVQDTINTNIGNANLAKILNDVVVTKIIPKVVKNYTSNTKLEDITDANILIKFYKNVVEFIYGCTKECKIIDEDASMKIVENIKTAGIEADLSDE